jgi:hypothetical protein
LIVFSLIHFEVPLEARGFVTRLRFNFDDGNPVDGYNAIGSICVELGAIGADCSPRIGKSLGVKFALDLCTIFPWK